MEKVKIAYMVDGALEYYTDRAFNNRAEAEQYLLSHGISEFGDVIFKAV